VEEAKMAMSHGADALGLVGKMPSGPGPIADELIDAIAKTIHPPVASFLLTSEQ
jgi:phosphoribosylanthranilate isomerase